MPRPSKCRRVCAHPRCTHFEPRGAAAGTEPVTLHVDEFEAVRLMDHEGLTQEECAQRMGVARTTVTGIYMRARRKIALALVEGRPLVIRGGAFEVCPGAERGCGCHRCHRRAQEDLREKQGTVKEVFGDERRNL